jgi:flagellar biosynthesis GTPase FlhF
MSTTTARTGLMEKQLREISSVIRGKSSTSTPIISEAVNKRRRLDSVIDKSSEFFSRASSDSNSHRAGESLVNLMMIQSTQWGARLDERRREDTQRDFQRRDDIIKRKEAAALREEVRQREKEEKEERTQEEREQREERRRKEDYDREVRREKNGKDLAEMMLLFLDKK